MKKCGVTEAIFSAFWHAIIVTWFQKLRFFSEFSFYPILDLLWKVYTVIQYYVLHKLFIIQSYYLSYSLKERPPPLWKLVATPTSLGRKFFSRISVRSNVKCSCWNGKYCLKLNFEKWASGWPLHGMSVWLLH